MFTCTYTLIGGRDYCWWHVHTQGSRVSRILCQCSYDTGDEKIWKRKEESEDRRVEGRERVEEKIGDEETGEEKRRLEREERRGEESEEERRGEEKRKWRENYRKHDMIKKKRGDANSKRRDMIGN